MVMDCLCGTIAIVTKVGGPRSASSSRRERALSSQRGMASSHRLQLLGPQPPPPQPPLRPPHRQRRRHCHRNRHRKLRHRRKRHRGHRHRHHSRRLDCLRKRRHNRQRHRRRHHRRCCNQRPVNPCKFICFLRIGRHWNSQSTAIADFGKCSAYYS